MVGYKLGNIAKVMQDAFGLDQPDYGYLLASIFAYEGTTLEREHYIEPFVELEPAFVLKHSLRGPNVTVADVINAIDYAVPAIEIIDSRVQDWAIDLPDTLADNGIHRRGHPRRNSPAHHRSHPARHARLPALQRPRGHRRKHQEHPRQPLAAVAWLCNRLAAYDVEFQPARSSSPAAACRQCP